MANNPTTISSDDIREFLRTQRYAVQASVTPDAAPQAAVIGIAVSDALEIIFDTLESTRKWANLRANPRIALVIGGLAEDDPRTVQYEGIADEPAGAELERIRKIYFDRFPDGRDRLVWPGITRFRVKPTWLRFSDYHYDPPLIVELEFDGEGRILGNR
jgi:uncharacterized protein YhbP (UPF0306 family)